jgi:hypothetical protein
MPTELRRTLARLRKSLSGKAEQAYAERDAPGATSAEKDHAAGEGEAFGIASDDVREEQLRQERDADSPPG